MKIAELVETLAAQQSVKHICKRITTLQEATRLWNWIDEQNEPEMLWAVMLSAVPWAFANTNGTLQHRVNSIKFAYNDDSHDYGLYTVIQKRRNLDIGEFWDSRTDEDGEFWQLCDEHDSPVRCQSGIRSRLLCISAAWLTCGIAATVLFFELSN